MPQATTASLGHKVPLGMTALQVFKVSKAQPALKASLDHKAAELLARRVPLETTAILDHKVPLVLTDKPDQQGLTVRPALRVQQVEQAPLETTGRPEQPVLKVQQVQMVQPAPLVPMA